MTTPTTPTTPETTTVAPAAATAAKKKAKRKISEGIANIQASFNNTLVSICTPSGDVLCQGSAGRAGFKGSRKGTPFAAQLAAEAVAKKAIEEFALRRVTINVSGPGAGRDSAVRALRNAGLEVMRLVDNTPLPHNGCRPRKKRRV
ncbi:MAG: 30S ribosomal protein S11 [Gammaproteobacteria bacterium RIFCSPLOWO2_02_FULL_42_14]|nr:MAG: 30S ribosomal protein S11 [Gammaproteobacteria bacterium RIFCSPHIGHO2_02_FULL_42_43]OGT28738.1 MAG: 30S ribosomal protein S11 [Gammaproteobacteria bacterium RIFCSPHIGHO2_01_FULL_42_8]OGT52166.1 MAG: 30S ribosomal protein S11 [Gammaproteobacteria bacterium RIFCSPHIGHO2_12_FULL_41_25]OGT62604.1 MAG: 30S ribosomal protein S11 [Gammaproteobacteria bacterium RIFCSPLOWO2_02_FULL_42_14]OGT86586.1 MAG: 30S ribosomal protein S11 [Gammaproteobacteria bacterium RIFCSPLOWO2_12_FULL_42_18]